MPYEIKLSEDADAVLAMMENDAGQAKRLRAVRKTLAMLEHNPRHPGLQTHEYHSKKGPHGQKAFEAYAENRTPGAYRVLWCYGPEKGMIFIIAITPHP